ncbi:E3 ubiquitin-protein ligase ARIH1 [Elysia marginata]|uniref:RBR-type E3 ubiquitin transferase n=1 Tax=Elysia marginata TaxID=1093978 RepID=A0AAV4FXU8_9GAST|nr:E3 ubiquitin-protein ligase ARIH1 [Elysia marginata]
MLLFRYARQACMIGRSNLSAGQVENLLQESADDHEIKSALGNTDVLLSLNKRGRWRLPATVSHMIKEGCFSKTNTMVSLLERHKLKRRANCVAFACSKEPGSTGLGFCNQNTNTLKESQKKYFSYNLDYVDRIESRRQMKKRIAEEVKKEGRQSSFNVKTVDVFTIEGRKANSLTSSTPLYNLEVFYPCPQSCSLAHNPKYTDVIMARNDDGEMEVRSNTNNVKKSKTKRRTGFTKSDLVVLNSEMATLDGDVEEMWREVYEDTKNFGISKQGVDAIERQGQETTSKNSEENYYSCNWRNSSYSLLDCVMVGLIDQAARAQRAHSYSFPIRQRKRSGRIVENSLVRIRATSQEANTQIDHPYTFLHKRSNSRKLYVPSITSKGYPVLTSFPVILSSTEVTSQRLRAKFRNKYAEADCQPRRFCINITEPVRNTMSVYRNDKSSMYNTYVVFTSVGIYDNGLETYRVMVNCAGCTDPEHFTLCVPYDKVTIEEIINTILGSLLDLKKSGHKNFSNTISIHEQRNYSPVQERTMGKLKMRFESFFTSDELSRISKRGDLHEKIGNTMEYSQSLMEIGTNCDVESFCEICYDIIDFTQKETVQATQLNACGHLFCDLCWQTHLRTQFREGAVHMVCPGYQCKTQLGPSTLLSLLHVTEVAHILQRACEDEVEVCPTAKWCPSPSCGRVIRLATISSENPTCAEAPTSALDMSLDVTCGCGEEWCFTCLSPAHWPAGCEQAQAYLDMSRRFKPRQDTLDNDVDVTTAKSRVEEPLEVEGRLCPRCGRFIYKNGGCPHMMCKCGHNFCWTCLLPNFGYHNCNPDPKTIKAYTRVVKVRHVAQLTSHSAEVENSEKKTKMTKTSRYVKNSMFHRAIQQREEGERVKERRAASKELSAKLYRVASQDPQFKIEVLRMCGISKSNMPDSGNGLAAGDMVTRQNLLNSLTRYLNSVQRSRQAMHQVAEYTFVLLQDFPASTEKRRAFRVASDLIACCSFSSSVFQAGGNQDPRTALRRLSEIETWSNRALDTLLVVVHRLRYSV